MKWYKLSDLRAELGVFLECQFSQIDILHYLEGEHSAQFIPPILKFFRRARPKIVVTYHQPPDLLNSLVIKEILSKIDAIVVMSPEQADYFHQFLPKDKIHFIPHGIDTTYYRPGRRLKESHQFHCITVGHWLRDYRVVREVAIRLRQYTNIKFQLVSPQSTELSDLENVTIYQGISDAELLELYQQADVLFLPLIQSTANNSLLEGIACGLPVISSNLPSVKAYLGGKGAILINSNDPKPFAEAILHLVENPLTRQNMSNEARKRAEELDWRNIAPKYEKLYSQVSKMLT